MGRVLVDAVVLCPQLNSAGVVRSHIAVRSAAKVLALLAGVLILIGR